MENLLLTSTGIFIFFDKKVYLMANEEVIPYLTHPPDPCLTHPPDSDLAQGNSPLSEHLFLIRPTLHLIRLLYALAKMSQLQENKDLDLSQNLYDYLVHHLKDQPLYHKLIPLVANDIRRDCYQTFGLLKPEALVSLRDFSQLTLFISIWGSNLLPEKQSHK